jgi:hypothetical protein
VVISLVAIDGYFMMVINGYFINGYWWLLYYKLLLDILGYIIIGFGSYFIVGYLKLFFIDYYWPF